MPSEEALEMVRSALPVLMFCGAYLCGLACGLALLVLERRERRLWRQHVKAMRLEIQLEQARKQAWR